MVVRALVAEREAERLRLDEGRVLGSLFDEIVAISVRSR